MPPDLDRLSKLEALRATHAEALRQFESTVGGDLEAHLDHFELLVQIKALIQAATFIESAASEGLGAAEAFDILADRIADFVRRTLGPDVEPHHVQ